MVGKPYTMLEMYDIVYYILEKKAFHEVKGRRMWDDFSRSGRTNRTWQSLKETFLKRILPDIHNPYYKLKPDEVASFRTCCDVTLNKNNNKLDIAEVQDSRSRGNNKSTPKKKTKTKDKGNIDSELSEASSTDTFKSSKSRKSGSVEMVNLSDDEMGDNEKSKKLDDKNKPSTSKQSGKGKKKHNSESNVTGKKTLRSESVHSSVSNASSTDTLVLGKSLMRKSSSVEILNLSDNETADVTNQKKNNPNDDDLEAFKESSKGQQEKCIRDRFMYSDPLTPMMQSIIDDFETDSSLENSDSEPPIKKARKVSNSGKSRDPINHTDKCNVTSTNSASKSESTIPNNQEALEKSPCNTESAENEPDKTVKETNSQLESSANHNKNQTATEPQDRLNVAPEKSFKQLENLTAIADKSLQNITEENHTEKSHQPSNNCTNSTDSFLPANPEALPPQSENTNEENVSANKRKKKLHSLSEPIEKTHVTLRNKITLSAPDPSRPFRCATSSDRETSESPERNKQSNLMKKLISKDSAHLKSINETDENSPNHSKQETTASTFGKALNVAAPESKEKAIEPDSESKEKTIEPDSESNFEILNETASKDVPAADLHNRETIDSSESNRPESPIVSANKADSDETLCEGSVVKSTAETHDSECTIVNKPEDPKKTIADTYSCHTVEEKETENRTNEQNLKDKPNSASIDNELESCSGIDQTTPSITTKNTAECDSSASNNTSLLVNPGSVNLTESNSHPESVSLYQAPSKTHTLPENSDHEESESLHEEEIGQGNVETKERRPQEHVKSTGMGSKSDIRNPVNDKEHSNKQVNNEEKLKKDNAQDMKDDDETQKTDDSKQVLLRHNVQRNSSNSESSEPANNKLKTLVLDRMFGFSSGVRCDQRKDEHSTTSRNPREKRPRHSGRNRRSTGSSDDSTGSDTPPKGNEDSIRLPEYSRTARYVGAPKAVPLRKLLDDGTLVAVCDDGVYPLVRQRGDDIYYLHYLDEDLDQLRHKTPRHPPGRSNERVNPSREFLSDHEGHTNDASYWRNMFYKQKEKVDGLSKLLGVNVAQLQGQDRASDKKRCEAKGPVQEPTIETNVATTSTAQGNQGSDHDAREVRKSVIPNNPATSNIPGTSVNPATSLNPATSVNPASSVNPATSLNPASTVPTAFRINLAKGERSVTIDGHNKDDLKEILGQIINDYLDMPTPAKKLPLATEPSPAKKLPPAKKEASVITAKKSTAAKSKSGEAVRRKPSIVTLDENSDMEVRARVDKMEAAIFAEIASGAAAEGSTAGADTSGRSQEGTPTKKEIIGSFKEHKITIVENNKKETQEANGSTSLEDNVENKVVKKETQGKRVRSESGSDKEIIMKKDLEQVGDVRRLSPRKPKARRKDLEDYETDAPRAKRRLRNQPDSDPFISPKKTRSSNSGNSKRNQTNKQSPILKSTRNAKKSSKNFQYLSVPQPSTMASSSFESSQRSDDSVGIDPRLLQMRQHKRMSLPNLQRTRAESSKYKVTRKRRCSFASSMSSLTSVVDFEQKRQEMIRKSKSSITSSTTLRPPSTDLEFCRMKYRSESSFSLTPPKPTFGAKDVGDDYICESDVGSQADVSPAELRLDITSPLLPGLDVTHKPNDDNKNSSNVSLPPSPEISIVEKIHLDTCNITKNSNFSTMNEQQISVIGRGSTIQISGIERLPLTVSELDKSINGFERHLIHEATVAFMSAVEPMEASETKCVENMEISEQALKTVNTVTDSLLSKIENVNIGEAKSLSETIQKGLADIQLDSGVKGRRRGTKKAQAAEIVVKTRSRSSTPNKRSKVTRVKKPNIDTVIEEEMHVDSFAKSMSEGAVPTNACLADIVPKKRRGRPKKSAPLSDLTNIETPQPSEFAKVSNPKARLKKSTPSQSNDNYIPTTTETVKPKRVRKPRKSLANTTENIDGNSAPDSKQVESAKSKRVPKKSVIKVKVTKPKKSASCNIQQNAHLSDSGINDLDPLLSDVDESVDLIHNHSDTCLSFQACHFKEREDSVVLIEQKVDLVNTTLDLTPPNCTMEDTNTNSSTTKDDAKINNDSGIAKPGDSMVFQKDMVFEKDMVCEIDPSSPDSRSSVLSLCLSPGLARSLSVCSDSLLPEYFTEDASTASRSLSQTSKWHLLSEDESCDSTTPFDAAQWALKARHSSYLAKLFPVICSVPELSTVTENSEQSKDDSRARTLAPREPDGLDSS